MVSGRGEDEGAEGVFYTRLCSISSFASSVYIWRVIHTWKQSHQLVTPLGHLHSHRASPTDFLKRESRGRHMVAMGFFSELSIFSIQ
jgi:hypothetical protein